MGRFLAELDALPAAVRWPKLRSWMHGEPLALFAELRAERPVLALPELTFVTRYQDCATVLRRHDDFGVDLYVPKQGSYWMAQDDTAQHWRDKSVMRAILDHERVPAMRAFIGQAVDAALDQAGGEIEVVAGITRHAPVRLVQQFFGFEDADADDLVRWSYWNQQDAFHNQPFDPVTPEQSAHIVEKRKQAGIQMALFLGRTVAKRAIAEKLGRERDDPISRLLRLTFADAVKFNLKSVAINTGGLLIGAVETTNHAAVNALDVLMSRPADFAAAVAAAPDPARFDGFVFEALRFRPAFPYFFRVCKRPTVLAGGTPHAAQVPAGTTVLAVTHSAMFDEGVYPDPTRFDPTRSPLDGFTFGQGIHECLGRVVAANMLPEIVRRLLLRPGLRAVSDIAWKGGVPETWRLAWDA